MENPLYKSILEKIAKLADHGFVVYGLAKETQCMRDSIDTKYTLALPKILVSFTMQTLAQERYTEENRKPSNVLIKLSGEEVDIGSSNASKIAQDMLERYEKFTNSLKESEDY